MFRRFQRFYNAIKLLADELVLVCAFGLAYGLRFYSGLPHEAIPPMEDTLWSLAVVLLVFPLIFRQMRLYRTNRARTHWGEVGEILRATVVATVVLVTLTYFFRERYSRITLLMFVTLAFVLLSTQRILFRSVLNKVRRRGYNVHYVLMIGTGSLSRQVVKALLSHRELGLQVRGHLTHEPEELRSSPEGMRILGGIDDIGRVLDEEQVDHVIVALPFAEQAVLAELMRQMALRTVDVKIVPDLGEYVTLKGGFEEFGGLPMVALQSAPVDAWSRMVKRSVDVVGALLLLVLLSPLMLLLALWVKLDSRGPVLYRQERMGMDGRLFWMLKFRTMRVDAEAVGAQMTLPKDARRTRLGGVLRKFSLDELPQLWNVLWGEMSLVGPRPERPIFIEEFKKRIPRYHLRHMVKSGMTGLAQVRGLRGQSSIEERIEADLFYIENWSPLLDMKILVKTVFGGFLSKNAY
ncbi:MAG: undecaprenyl-phosphate glucose phosphotransferase [Proteobacteria bacterium]|nr:undecaprenyl-phosphate glucose phosphotransferase [Cystobacterineae bacterium]MCL2258672.1 undecaprenyl-phosphate glucose phosphotransferase [Cystobacterineae bacterium]MCL2314924.1 undecaprenyl-phosphate glucose phosphotransferase [Pseudomonadota bacterium]